MPKRKQPELTPAEQFKLFREAAKKAGATEDNKEFERVFKAIVKPRKHNQTKPRT